MQNGMSALGQKADIVAYPNGFAAKYAIRQIELRNG